MGLSTALILVLGLTVVSLAQDYPDNLDQEDYLEKDKRDVDTMDQLWSVNARLEKRMNRLKTMIGGVYSGKKQPYSFVAPGEGGADTAPVVPPRPQWRAPPRNRPSSKMPIFFPMPGRYHKRLY